MLSVGSPHATHGASRNHWIPYGTREQPWGSWTPHGIHKYMWVPVLSVGPAGTPRDHAPPMGSAASHGAMHHTWGQQHAMGLLDTLWDQSAPVGLLNTRQNPWISCRSLGYLQNQRTPHGAPKYPMGAGSTLGAPQHPMEYRDTCRYPVLSTGPHSIPDLIPGNCGSSRHPHDPTTPVYSKHPVGPLGIPWDPVPTMGTTDTRGTLS